MNKHLIGVAIVVSGTLLGCSKNPAAPTQSDVRVTQGVTAESAAERLVEARAQEMAAQGPALSAFASAAIAYHAPPEVFGVPVSARLFYAVAKDQDGNVSGLFAVSQTVDVVTNNYTGHFTCMGIYDFDGGRSNRAKIGGQIDTSDDPEAPPGVYMWWQQIDNARSPGHPPDKSTFGGFGDEAANIAFCQSPNPPRFGPFPLDDGDIIVKVFGPQAAASAAE